MFVVFSAALSFVLGSLLIGFWPSLPSSSPSCWILSKVNSERLRCLSVDVASVVWDLFLLDGEALQRGKSPPKVLFLFSGSVFIAGLKLLSKSRSSGRKYWKCLRKYLCNLMFSLFMVLPLESGGPLLHSHCDPSNFGAPSWGGDLLQSPWLCCRSLP